MAIDCMRRYRVARRFGADRCSHRYSQAQSSAAASCWSRQLLPTRQHQRDHMPNRTHAYRYHLLSILLCRNTHKDLVQLPEQELHVMAWSCEQQCLSVGAPVPFSSKLPNWVIQQCRAPFKTNTRVNQFHLYIFQEKFAV